MSLLSCCFWEVLCFKSIYGKIDVFNLKIIFTSTIWVKMVHSGQGKPGKPWQPAKQAIKMTSNIERETR